MFYAIVVILLIAWLLGLVGIYKIGAAFHGFLILAIVLLVVGWLNGRRSTV